MYTATLRSLLPVLCIALQALAVPVPFLGGGIFSGDGGLIFEPFSTFPFWGFLTNETVLEYRDEPIRDQASLLSSSLATVDLLYTIETTVTSVSGLNSVLASSLTSEANSGIANATATPQTVTMTLCVPTPSTRASSSGASKTAIAKAAPTADAVVITSSPAVGPAGAVPSSVPSAHVTTITSNGVALPIIHIASHVESTAGTVGTMIPSAPHSSFSDMSNVDDAVTDDTSSSAAAPTEMPIAPSATAPFFSATATATTTVTTISTTDATGRMPFAIGGAILQDIERRDDETGGRPVRWEHSSNCSYPQINGHRIARDGAGGIVIMVEDPWFEFPGIGLELGLRRRQGLLGDVCRALGL